MVAWTTFLNVVSYGQKKDQHLNKSKVLYHTSKQEGFFFIVLGFNDTSTLVGHFVSSPREREKRDRRGDEKKGQGRRRKMNESEESEEVKAFPSTPPTAKVAGFAQL